MLLRRRSILAPRWRNALENAGPKEWLSAPSHTLAPVTRRAPVARARSLIRWTTSRTSAVSCISGVSFCLQYRGKLIDDPLCYRLDGVGNLWRQRCSRSELLALDKVSDEMPRQLAEAARQLDGFRDPECVARGRRKSDRERPIGEIERWTRPGWLIAAAASMTITKGIPFQSSIRARASPLRSTTRTVKGARPRNRWATVGPKPSSPRSGLPIPATSARARSLPFMFGAVGTSRNVPRRRCRGHGCECSARSWPAVRGRRDRGWQSRRLANPLR